MVQEGMAVQLVSAAGGQLHVICVQGRSKGEATAAAVCRSWRDAHAMLRGLREAPSEQTDVVAIYTEKTATDVTFRCVIRCCIQC